MSIEYLGSYTIGGLLPSVVSLLAAAQARAVGQLAGAARISGQLAFTLPSIAARVTAAARLAAQIALQPPSVQFNIGANVALIAALKAQLALIADLFVALGSAGVECYLYDGTAQSFGGEVNGATAQGLPGGAPSDHMNAFVIATRYPAAWAALCKVLFA
jgi:hypothetical protein